MRLAEARLKFIRCDRNGGQRAKALRRISPKGFFLSDVGATRSEPRGTVPYLCISLAQRVILRSSCALRSADTEARKEAVRCFGRSDRSAEGSGGRPDGQPARPIPEAVSSPRPPDSRQRHELGGRGLGETRIGCGAEVLVSTSQETTLSSASRASRIADQEVVRASPLEGRTRIIR
jgi:hypothetical protein